MKRTIQLLSMIALVITLFSTGPLLAQGKVDVNKADVKGLMSLKGIGEVKAKAIVKYRQMKGPFTKPEDLTGVPGIGGKIVQQNKAYISVGNIDMHK